MGNGIKEYYPETKSLCPVCLETIPGRRVYEGNNVFLEKTCLAHGSYKTILWRSATYHYEDWNRYTGGLKGPKKRLSDMDKGCPYDCGPCPNHKQEICTMIMEITNRCNLRCSFCFASANEIPVNEPTLKEIARMFETILDLGGPYPIQLSGGEPTVRDDLPMIVAMGERLGFDHIQINTNGIKIAQDVSYAKKLKDSGASVIYLQFDGLNDNTYQLIRKKRFLDIKVKAINNCSQAQIGVILVPTIIPGVNDSQIGNIIQFAKGWIPTVKGVHFQPVTYTGRYPKVPRDADRISIPEILGFIENQTGGEIRAENFLPASCQEAHCSFSGTFVLMENGLLFPLTHFKIPNPKSQIPNLKVNILQSEIANWYKSPPEKARDFIRKRWRFIQQDEPKKKGCGCSSGCSPNSEPDPWLDFFERVQRDYLTISGMVFQDVWNIDLERLEKCCIYVVRPDRKMIPFCAFNLSSAQGKKLYR